MAWQHSFSNKMRVRGVLYIKHAVQIDVFAFLPLLWADCQMLTNKQTTNKQTNITGHNTSRVPTLLLTKTEDFSRTFQDLINNFLAPVWSQRMSKYKEKKTAFTYLSNSGIPSNTFTISLAACSLSILRINCAANLITTQVQDILTHTCSK